MVPARPKLMYIYRIFPVYFTDFHLHFILKKNPNIHKCTWNDWNYINIFIIVNIKILEIKDVAFKFNSVITCIIKLDKISD